MDTVVTGRARWKVSAFRSSPALLSPDRIGVWARKPAEDEADRTAGVRNVLDNTQLYAVATAAPGANERAVVVGRRLRQELRAAQLRVLLGPAAPDACRAARLGCLSIGSSDSTT
jgi:hypothetical protein